MNAFLNHVALLVVSASLATSLNAQPYGLLGRYAAIIGPEDLVSSNGVPLDDIGAVLQQDRANFHRFGQSDAGDTADPFFGDRDLRALIPQIYVVRGYEERLRYMMYAGLTPRVEVLICGRDGVPTTLAVIPEFEREPSDCF